MVFRICAQAATLSALSRRAVALSCRHSAVALDGDRRAGARTAQLLAVGFIAIMVATLAGAALGTYHSGVEWHWWAGPTECSGPIADLSAKGRLLDQLQTVHVVRCDEAAWRLFGISLAGYNVLISLALAAIAGYGLFASRRSA